MAQKQTKPLNVVIKIRMPDGNLVNWDDLNDKEKETIGNKLNEQAMRTLGYERVDEKEKNAI